MNNRYIEKIYLSMCGGSIYVPKYFKVLTCVYRGSGSAELMIEYDQTTMKEYRNICMYRSGDYIYNEDQFFLCAIQNAPEFNEPEFVYIDRV